MLKICVTFLFRSNEGENLRGDGVYITQDLVIYWRDVQILASLDKLSIVEVTLFFFDLQIF